MESVLARWIIANDQFEHVVAICAPLLPERLKGAVAVHDASNDEHKAEEPGALSQHEWLSLNRASSAHLLQGGAELQTVTNHSRE